MDTFLKLTSVKDKNNCNCISPFYINDISGINPNTGRNYASEDKDILKSALYRISNARGCNLSVCCDPNDPSKTPDEKFTNEFIQKYPKIMPVYTGSSITSIKLSTNGSVTGNGWVAPTPYMICKITKATISDTSDPTIKIASKLVNNCFTNQCNPAKSITLNTLLQTSKLDMKYTYLDDTMVAQALAEGNITYVKQYIRKYKMVDSALTNDDYNNRMIHLAAAGKSLDILNMLIALKANLNVTNKMRETPLHFAVRSKNTNNMDALLSQGVDMTLVNNKGETAMFYAMKTGNMNIINMLYNNGASVLGVDKMGNNLIHYCILNCPSYNEDDDTVPNTKSEIIKFLVDHGISTEQKNLKGISPLEMVGKEINKEINKECDLAISKDTDNIKEKFFNTKAIEEGFASSTTLPSVNSTLPSVNSTLPSVNSTLPSSGPTIKPTKIKYGAKENNISGGTTEHKSLLEIQTMLFNNIIKNNPNKYNKYISVKDIPKGAPIEVLDTVCVGDGMTGNEDSDECIAAGGQLVKVKNQTTKIKLELIQEDDTVIDELDESELYYKKNPRKAPKDTIPANIKEFNDNVIKNGPITYTNGNTVPQTTGFTYNIGQESTNVLNSIEGTLGFNPQPTKGSINTVPSITIESGSIPVSIPTSMPKKNPITTYSNKTATAHPPMFDDEVIHKCQSDAIRNSTKITEAQNTTTSTFPNVTQGKFESITIYIDTYKKYIIGFLILIVLLIGFLIYKNYSNNNPTNPTNNATNNATNNSQ
uniref:Uncharacterized protein n=1 Tax=viral metagenome TaxID=1070528 RepID=A0A6C0EXZ2_9ZZZZ